MQIASQNIKPQLTSLNLKKKNTTSFTGLTSNYSHKHT